MLDLRRFIAAVEAEQPDRVVHCRAQATNGTDCCTPRLGLQLLCQHDCGSRLPSLDEQGDARSVGLL